jgi:hypothetical protein
LAAPHLGNPETGKKYRCGPVRQYLAGDAGRIAGSWGVFRENSYARFAASGGIVANAQ